MQYDRVLIFSELKWLELNVGIGGPTSITVDGIQRRFSDILLFDILRVDKMSLLKFYFIFQGGKMVIRMI